MKTVVNISLGSSDDDFDFTTRFMDTDFHVMRFGTNGNTDVAAELLEDWDTKADAIGLGSVLYPHPMGKNHGPEKEIEKVCMLGEELITPVTTGHALRTVGHEWSIRHIQYTFGNNYFNNCRVLFLSGMINITLAEVLSEYTDNLKFCDPVIENGIPKLLSSIDALKKFASGFHEVLNWIPSRSLLNYAMPLKSYNDYIIRRAISNSSIIVVPYYNFYKYLDSCGINELSGKIVITSTAYDDRVKFLQQRGVSVIIDTTPKMLERVVGVSVLEAMIMTVLGKSCESLTRDDLLEVIVQHRMDPRVIYPSGLKKRVNRFAFVVHPLSKDYLKKIQPIGLASKVLPEPGMDAVEKLMAYSPPFVYSKVTGIRSPNGVEAEGWLIAIGLTPKQMLAHPPEFINERLIKAVSIAKNLGAQIVGLGALTKAMGDAGVTVAKNAPIPVTTGNSYSASAALWAAAEAVRRMGLIKMTRGKKLRAKTMVIGATGAVGSVCSKLLATAFDELYMIDIHDAKLLALRTAILNEFKDVKVKIGTRADRFLADMDVIVTATSHEPGRALIDIMEVKPGCVITDVNRPLNFSLKDAEARPDVLIIASGEIKLPGQPEMKDIGLAPGVAYASLAEAVVLALEGRFENFSVGREIEWKKVSEIYKMGLKHGMKLASISGINGPLTDADFQRVAELAKKKR